MEEAGFATKKFAKVLIFSHDRVDRVKKRLREPMPMNGVFLAKREILIICQAQFDEVFERGLLKDWPGEPVRMKQRCECVEKM